MKLNSPDQVATLRVPRLEEVDLKELQKGRLARLQETMRRYEFPVCLFFNPANIRYATGTDTTYINSLELFWRYCVVPAEGAPILFEVPGTFHHAKKMVDDVRPAIDWAYVGHGAAETAKSWVKEISDVLSELGVGDSVLALDRIDTDGFLALQGEGIRLVDSSPVTADAREVKTP